MLTADERRARYAAQAGNPAGWTPTGPQASRIAHKDRHVTATGTRQAARTATAAVRAARRADRDGLLRALIGGGRKPAVVKRPALPWTAWTAPTSC